MEKKHRRTYLLVAFYRRSRWKAPEIRPCGVGGCQLADAYRCQVDQRGQPWKGSWVVSLIFATNEGKKHTQQKDCFACFWTIKD